MKQEISIVFHSGYGHTHKVAETVAQGSGGSLLRIEMPSGDLATALAFGERIRPVLALMSGGR